MSQELFEAPKPKTRKSDTTGDALTVVKVGKAKSAYIGDVPTVRVTLPLPPGAEEGTESDIIERVTHNGYKYEIRRGYPVDIPVPVFMILKQGKYKNTMI